MIPGARCEKVDGGWELIVPKSDLGKAHEAIRRLSEPALPITAGDTVWMGDGRVHWIVLTVQRAGTVDGTPYVYAMLKSGLTGRRRPYTGPLANLRLYEGKTE